jgi:hypothetical protein
MRSMDRVNVAPKVDCITTSVAIAAQYASGIPISRATQTETVAAAAVLIECVADGRFSFFQLQSFIGAMMSSVRRWWQACAKQRKTMNRAFSASLLGD